MLYRAISDRILKQLSGSTNINMEYRAVYSYALEKYISGIVNTLIFILIAIAFRIPTEAIAFFAFYAPLRRVAGGRHARTRSSCLLLSIILMISIIKISVFLSGLTEWYLIILAALSAAAVLVFLYAPVDCENKRFTMDGRIRNKKAARWIITADCLLILSAMVYFSALKCYIVIAAMALLLEGALLIPNRKHGGCVL